ncbi:hypothetical protein LguiB_027999 [Lonicera macranthoides]
MNMAIRKSHSQTPSYFHVQPLEFVFLNINLAALLFLIINYYSSYKFSKVGHFPYP